MRRIFLGAAGFGLLIAAAAVPSALAQTPARKAPVKPEDVRPPASLLVDCAKAPADAVTKLPDSLAAWGTIYCTRLGHIFNANDRHFGAFPDNGVRATFSAAEMAGLSGEAGADAYFTAVSYRELAPQESAALIALDPDVRRILVGHSLWRLDLTAKGGATLAFIAIDPKLDPFWVFPLNAKGLGSPAFYVTSLDALNQVR